jgi:hypothetical protein
MFRQVERGGRVRAFPMSRATSANLKAALKKHAHPKVKLMTDDFSAYATMNHPDHHTVNHASGEYVRGEVHTNTAEGFFSLLKRGINGVYHHVGRGHVHRYCSEFAFRYNNRIKLGVDDGQRAAKLVLGAEGKRLTYKQPAAS